MKKVRIVERINTEDYHYTKLLKKVYVIQQKHFIFWWMWVDAAYNYLFINKPSDTYHTLEYAKEMLRYFDGTKNPDKIIYKN